MDSLFRKLYKNLSSSPNDASYELLNYSSSYNFSHKRCTKSLFYFHYQCSAVRFDFYANAYALADDSSVSFVCHTRCTRKLVSPNCPCCELRCAVPSTIDWKILYHISHTNVSANSNAFSDVRRKYRVDWISFHNVHMNTFYCEFSCVHLVELQSNTFLNIRCICESWWNGNFYHFQIGSETMNC